MHSSATCRRAARADCGAPTRGLGAHRYCGQWLLLLLATAFAPQAVLAQAGVLDSVRSWTAGATRTPHPAVVKVYAYNQESVARGSGTLIHVAGEHGFVISNWHVVRDAPSNTEVVFPDGFRSPATVLRMDQRWDLALLAIRAPRAAPMPMARRIPQIGDMLTIAGYGSGDYRAVRGHCAQFVAPEPGAPFEMIEVAVSARQGDSGGPIINDDGELAAVLFGTGQGLTTGSHIGRVNQFLAEVRQALGAPPTDPAHALDPASNSNGTPAAPSSSQQGALELPPPFHPAGMAHPAGTVSQATPNGSTSAAQQPAQSASRTDGPSPLVPLEPSAIDAQRASLASAANTEPGPLPRAEQLTNLRPSTRAHAAVQQPAPPPFDPLAAGAPLPADVSGEHAPGPDVAQPDASKAIEKADPNEPVAHSKGWIAGAFPSPAKTFRLEPVEPHVAMWGTEPGDAITLSDLAGETLWDKIKSVFALAGVIAVAYVLLHLNPS